jgi:hypothetical protein
MTNINTRKDFSQTDFIGKGLILVSDLEMAKFFLVDERKYDNESHDQLECEKLYRDEKDNEIQYFRYEPKISVVMKRGLLQSVILQS